MYLIGEMPPDTHLLFLIPSHMILASTKWFLTETVIAVVVAKW